MRALVIGLVGSALLGGAASAAECPLGRTVYEAVATEDRLYGTEIERPDLAGARFSVVQHAGRYRSIKEAGFSEPTKIAQLSLTISGDKGRFVVERHYASHSSPSVTARSWPAAAAEARPGQTPQGADKAKAFFAGASDIAVLDGPLSGLKMKPVACRRAKQKTAHYEP